MLRVNLSPQQEWPTYLQRVGRRLPPQVLLPTLHPHPPSNSLSWGSRHQYFFVDVKLQNLIKFLWFSFRFYKNGLNIDTSYRDANIQFFKCLMILRYNPKMLNIRYSIKLFSAPTGYNRPTGKWWLCVFLPRYLVKVMSIDSSSPATRRICHRQWKQQSGLAPLPLTIFRLNSKLDQTLQCSGLKRT